MATRHQKQHLVAGIMVFVAGIACANPLPQRETGMPSPVPEIVALPTPYSTVDAGTIVIVTGEVVNLRHLDGSATGLTVSRGQVLAVLPLDDRYWYISEGQFKGMKIYKGCVRPNVDKLKCVAK